MLGIVKKLRSLGGGPGEDERSADPPRQPRQGPTSLPASAPVAVAVSGERLAADDPDALTDTIGAMLRSLGEGAFAMGEVPAATFGGTFDAWARHALVRAPHPERPDEPVGRRDWAGIRRFVHGHRKREQAYVTQTVEGLRDAVWSFVHGTARVLRSNDDADREVASQIRRLHGALGVRSVEQLRREVDSVAQALEQTLQTWREQQAAQVAELSARLGRLSSELEDARREGAKDGLTRLYNRKAFDAYVTRLSDMHGLIKTPSCLLLVDIDHFKSVNDRYGHPMGDEVIRSVADCLVRAFCRRTDFVARYGGEEFAVVLSDLRLEDARLPAERLVALVRAKRFTPTGKAPFGVTVSAGVAQLDERGAADWLERADEALYAAKTGGRDRIEHAS